jgi:hypothetical protein
MELDLYHFPDDLVYVSGFLDQNASVLQLDTMATVYAVIRHG